MGGDGRQRGDVREGRLPCRVEMARGLLDDGEFVEIHVDTPVEVAESRDVEGLYRKARRGELKNFTGIDAPYERPEQPDLRLDTAAVTVAQAVEALVAHLRHAGILDPAGVAS